MGGFVEEVKPIDECLRIVRDALVFPWDIGERELRTENAWGVRSSRDILSPEMSPPFTRSLRDGYAVRASETAGASSGSPLFLKLEREISMGETPGFSISPDAAAPIPTGGMLPRGADAVVMTEDAEISGGWAEIRKAVFSGENVALAGEEKKTGDIIVSKGDFLGFAEIGVLASFGVTSVHAANLKVGVVSTGDEIVPMETSPLPSGFIRDVNAYTVSSLLRGCGFETKTFGIVKDSESELKKIALAAARECDVVLISGGSSVGARDYTAKIIDGMGEPGLLIRGINMSPGKPTIIGGSLADKKLFAGLPGHPLSCVTAALFVVIPLLLSMIGAHRTNAGRFLRATLAEDVHGRTGPDEFIPMMLQEGKCRPLAAKSGYVSAMSAADGFIRLGPDVETKRRGEEADIWIW